MAGRLHGAKRHAAARGEPRAPLPVGSHKTRTATRSSTPNQEVQAAITDLFRAFAQTGSAYGVVGIFNGRRFPKRAPGSAWSELLWGQLSLARVTRIVHNPCYAGGV
jgi:hypothetical protein